MRIGQLTDTFSGVPSAWDSEDYSYYTLTKPNYALTDHSSTTHTTLRSNTGNGVSSWAYLLFDVSSIPANATIDSITCKVKARAYTATYVSGTVQLYSGTTAKGEAYTLSNSATAVSLTCGTWTRAELDNLRMKFTATRITSSTSTSYGLYIHGATLTVGYTYDQTYYTATITSSSSASVNPIGEVEYKAGEPYNISVFSDINKIRITDNGVNVTDQLVYLEPTRNISGYSNVSNTDTVKLNTLIGRGDTSTSNVGIYSSGGNGSNGQSRLLFDFSDIPDGLEVTDLYVKIKCSLESGGTDENSGFYVELVDSRGTRISKITDSPTSTTAQTLTLTLASGKNPSDYYKNFALKMYYAYYGGLVYGATAYLVLPSGNAYMSPITQDTTIHIKDYARYLKVAGAWADIKTIWVKRNGIWAIDKDYEFNNTTRYIQQNAFTQVEYLESTGTQYIELNIIPDAETGIYVKYTSSNNTDTYLAGLRETSGDTRWAIGHAQPGQYYGYGTWAYTSPAVTGLTAESYLNWMNNKKFISSDGTNTGEADLPTLSFTPTNKIRLFGSSGVAASYAAWLGKIYNVKVSQGSNIVLNLIPVRIGQTGYMYDTINNAFYGNMGTGSFILGGDIT